MTTTLLHPHQTSSIALKIQQVRLLSETLLMWLWCKKMTYRHICLFGQHSTLLSNPVNFWQLFSILAVFVNFCQIFQVNSAQHCQLHESSLCLQKRGHLRLNDFSSLIRTMSVGHPSSFHWVSINSDFDVQLDADILNGGNTEEQIRETFFEVKIFLFLEYLNIWCLVFWPWTFQVYKLFDDFGIIDKNKYLNINNEIKV